MKRYRMYKNLLLFIIIFLTYTSVRSQNLIVLPATNNATYCCGAYVNNGVWKEFLCHNLGADINVNPHEVSVTSWNLIGAWIKWGRRGPSTPTGNSAIDWQTAPDNGALGFAAAPTATDPNINVANWINASYPIPANNAWNFGSEAFPSKNTDDPCPPNYRVPTRNEWVGVAQYNTFSASGPWQVNVPSSYTNYANAIHYGNASNPRTLTLHASGNRYFSDGGLNQIGFYGYYWSSTPGLSQFGVPGAYLFQFNQGDPTGVQSQWHTTSLEFGFSIKCIKI